MERDFTVLFRVRPSFLPTSTVASQPIISINDDGRSKSSSHTSVTLLEPRTNSLSSNTLHTSHEFTADSCYLASSTTSDLFAAHVEPLIPFVLSGGYATVLAYGQTGSGKTYTLSECSRLAISALYTANASKSNLITVQAIEIYGKNKINDLFDPSNAKVLIAENISGSSTFVKATTKSVDSAHEMLQQVEQAWAQRMTRGTEKNPHSSRSHALIRILCQSTADKNATPGVLQLVDLAGSERAADHSPSSSSSASDSDAASKATRMAETVAINTSLMTLKNCIRARTSPSSSSTDAKGTAAKAGAVPHIPFRSSKLTMALKEAFDLYSRQPTHTLFIATASSDIQDVAATLNTFRYASALVASPHERIQLEPDALGRNVFFWTNARLAEWLVKYGQPHLTQSNVTHLLQGMDGSSFAKVPEREFYTRFESIVSSDSPSTAAAAGGRMGKGGKDAESAAKDLYLKWWKLVIASRTLSQKALEEQWKQRQAIKLQQEEQELHNDKEVQKLLRLPGIASAPSATAA